MDAKIVGGHITGAAGHIAALPHTAALQIHRGTDGIAGAPRSAFIIPVPA
jgi:hypothetical protein